MNAGMELIEHSLASDVFFSLLWSVMTDELLLVEEMLRTVWDQGFFD
jgi:hypothetical protein